MMYIEIEGIKERRLKMHTNVREYINLCRVKRGNITEAELARRTGQSPQNMNNKYKRNTFKISELEKVAEALDADLKISFIDKESGEAII